MNPLKAYATQTLPAVTAAAQEAAAANKLLSESFDASKTSAGFRKLLEFKDAQGETGGTTFTEAWKLLNAQLDREELLRKNPANAHLQIDVAQSMSKLRDFFQRFFNQLGDVQTLLKNLDRFRRAEEVASKSKQYGSQAAPSPQQPSSTASSASLKIMFITGKLP